MTDLILLGHDAASTHELTQIFQRAGYEVSEAKDVVSCCRQLQAEFRAPRFISVPGDASAAVHAPGVTILQAAAHGAAADTRQPTLLTCILSLARHLAPGWRLNLRHRRLEAPAGAGSVELTSLEFIFIRIFTMVETGEAVSRRRIVQEFGEDYLSYEQNRLDTMVKRLRKKVEANIGVKLPLNTERVRGYSFGDVLIIDP